MIPAGYGLMLRSPITANPKAEIVLRCTDCPGWSKRTTVAKRAADLEAHRRGARHRGRNRRGPDLQPRKRSS